MKLNTIIHHEGTKSRRNAEDCLFGKIDFLPSFVSSCLRGEIVFALFFVVIFSVGCGGRAVVKPQGGAAAATPAPIQAQATGPKTPALVELHGTVTDEDYKAALSEAGADAADRQNLDSFYTIGQYQYNHANFSEALKTYQKMLLVTNAASRMDKAQYMVGQVYYDKKDYLPALAAFQTVIQKYSKSPYAAQSRQMMEFMLSYSLGLDDLKRYVANYPDSPMNCFALFQLGSREAQANLQSDAIDHLNSYVEDCSQSPSAGAAKMLLQSLQSQQQGKTWKIGVLVPVTGRYKSVGQSVLNGITLAMEQANQAGGTRKPMSVVMKDTGSESIPAVKAFQELTKDGSIDAILGPVGSGEIGAVAPLANEQRIMLLSPSVGRDGLSTLGPYLFTNSMTNELQGRAIAKFAIEHLGFRRFGILSPEDSDGESRAEAFRKTVESMGATVLAAETYPTSSADFRKQLLALGGQDPQSSKENDRENARRLEELKYALKKEVGKILLKSKEVTGTAPDAAQPPAMAFAPLVEALSNTTTPSLVKDVNETLRDSWKEQTDFVLRNDDLVHQALDRLPVEFKGTTLPVNAEQWGDIAQDLQASLVVTGRVLQTNPPADWSDHPTWDFTVNLEAFQLNAKKTAFVKIYQSKVPYSSFKSASLIRLVTGYQALYLPAHTVEIPSLVSQIHFYDLNPVFLGSHTWANDSVLKEAGKDADGSYCVSGFYMNSAQGTVRKFSDDYLKRFAKQPDFLAAQAYDAARLLLKAAETAASRDDIHNNLLAIKDFDGVSGKTTFGGHGEAEKVVPILKIQNGKYEQVQ